MVLRVEGLVTGRMPFRILAIASLFHMAKLRDSLQYREGVDDNENLDETSTLVIYNLELQTRMIGIFQSKLFDEWFKILLWSRFFKAKHQSV